MKIFVTGCSGFMGQHLVKHLAKAGNLVWGIDLKPIDFEHPNFLFEYCDILDLDKLNDVLNRCKPNVIAHLAARTDLDETTSLSAYKVNFDGVNNLIDVIKQVPGISRCIFTSTQLVCQVGHVPKTSDEYCPNTLYGLSKVHGEIAVKEQNGGNVDWCIVRPTTVWGPGMSQHYQRFLRMINQGVFFHIDNRPLYKSYGYIGNVIYQYRALLTAPRDAIHGKTFYLADYESLSLREWANTLQRAMGAREIRSLPYWFAALSAKLGDCINFLGFSTFPFNSFRLNNTITEYCFDLTETAAVCGPLPYDMEHGVKETVNWLIETNVIPHANPTHV